MREIASGGKILGLVQCQDGSVAAIINGCVCGEVDALIHRFSSRNTFVHDLSELDEVRNTSAWWLLACGSGKQQQISIGIFDDEILGAARLLFQYLMKGNPSGLKLKRQ